MLLAQGLVRELQWLSSQEEITHRAEKITTFVAHRALLGAPRLKRFSIHEILLANKVDNQPKNTIAVNIFAEARVDDRISTDTSDRQPGIF